MTSVEPTPGTRSPSPHPGGKTDSDDAALCDALATEHAVIYGYGIVSAHCATDVNALVSTALGEHRERRDRVIAMLAARKVAAPVAAAGYQLPMAVNSPRAAARLAARMENDAAVAWRAVVEQAQGPEDREFGVRALTQSAVLAAQWNRVLGAWPITTAFPGGG
ncbi:MAG: ferritin-like domain-containing protein [Mycobacterium sp.]|uniref:ferritin-like domain-containing protein n=1 Tax=Mycobacterium sp. TaxID=1785 RepID=UPI002625B3EE|nr:ferritin-like domain-containing protein [Mycobacterium sp.]MDI3314358.1 ferritin-like domain-containing protein [Mycobacterium sp.]